MKTFKTTMGETITRTSRWINIKTAYDVTPRHALHYYADETGTVDYFTYQGKKYALNQFIRFGGVWGGIPIMWEENDKIHHLSGYDSENYYNPIMIEMSECCEAVRVYVNGGAI
jgi:hypothetical protein